MDVWLILLAPFILALLLAATHVFLGLHVLARGIIFVDLALAQIAALGAVLALLLGHDSHGWMARALAFAAAVTAALGFALLRRVPDKILREAVIGVVYVAATAATVLILSRSGVGLEELKAILNGNILWVLWDDVAIIAAVYALFGALHWCWRHKFSALSFRGEGGPIREIVFFVSFAITITLAVNVAGVLVVFAFLIMPALASSLLAQSLLARLMIGWALAALASACGLALAYAGDLPVGATVVLVLSVLPVVAGVIAWAR